MKASVPAGQFRSEANWRAAVKRPAAGQVMASLLLGYKTNPLTLSGFKWQEIPGDAILNSGLVLTVLTCLS